MYRLENLQVGLSRIVTHIIVFIIKLFIYLFIHSLQGWIHRHMVLQQRT